MKKDAKLVVTVELWGFPYFKDVARLHVSKSLEEPFEDPCVPLYLSREDAIKNAPYTATKIEPVLITAQYEVPMPNAIVVEAEDNDE